MRILFTAPENDWGKVLGLIRAEMPEHHFEATGRFAVDTLKGFDVLIPAMCPISQELLETGDRLRFIRQWGSGLEMVDLDAAKSAMYRLLMYPQISPEMQIQWLNWASIMKNGAFLINLSRGG